MENKRIDKRIRVKEKIKELKGFYKHLTAYLMVNMFISMTIILSKINIGDTFGEVFWSFETYAVWFFWGIGLASHAVKVFSYNPFFNKQWEERQLQKFMEEDKQQSEKYK